MTDREGDGGRNPRDNSEVESSVIEEAEELARAGEREKAEDLYRAALAGGLDVRLDYGNLLSDWPGREPEAEELYRTAIALGTHDALNNLATLLADMGRVEDADAVFKEAAALGDSTSARNYGLFLVSQGRLVEAERQFWNAINGGYLKACIDLGDLYTDIGRLDAAEELYMRALDAGLDAHVDYGILLSDELYRPAEAEREFLTALSIDPENGAAHLNLGALLVARGRLDEAETEYRVALALGEVNAATNLGLLLSAQQRLEEAERMFGEGLRSRDADAAMHYGRLLLRMGRFVEAETYLATAEEQGAGEQARTALTYVLQKLAEAPPTSGTT